MTSPIAVLGECYYCQVGFPKRDDGYHYGSQSKGDGKPIVRAPPSGIKEKSR